MNLSHTSIEDAMAQIHASEKYTHDVLSATDDLIYMFRNTTFSHNFNCLILIDQLSINELAMVMVCDNKHLRELALKRYKKVKNNPIRLIFAKLFWGTYLFRFIDWIREKLKGRSF